MPVCNPSVPEGEGQEFETTRGQVATSKLMSTSFDRQPDKPIEQKLTGGPGLLKNKEGSCFKLCFLF